MDPVTAVGLAASIWQLLDLGGTIFNAASEIRKSSSGLTKENQRTEDVVREMHSLALKLEDSTVRPQTDSERALQCVASQCRELSEEIIQLLKRIRPTNLESKRQITWSAWKNVRHKSEKIELEGKLARCRDQLGVLLTFVSSSDTKERLMNLATEQTRAYEMLQGHVKNFDRGVPITSFSTVAQGQIERLLELPCAAKNAIAQQHILSMLFSTEMRKRVDEVEDAHFQTFRWLLEEGSSGETPTLVESRKLFTDWLSHGSGVFHLAGKLGSGKSTLMKVLYNHDRTKRELNQWAGNRKLVIAGFFFWRPGSTGQKSFEGLRRSLLHDILKARPELIDKVFPVHWQRTISHISSQLPLSKTEELRNEEIRPAFDMIMNDPKIRRAYCFCFFLDALDEYEGGLQHDEKALTIWLKEWISPSVKMCVSSREYNVFNNAFSATQRIRLQDLTTGDMDRYVRDKLQDIQDHITRERLVNKIVGRSDGIFLWVVLVVKALRESHEEGEGFRHFEEELNTLPTELEKLFEYLLGKIQKRGLSAQQKAYQIFAMVFELAKQPKLQRVHLPLLSCLFLDDYNCDNQFAMKAHSSRSTRPSNSVEEKRRLRKEQIKQAERKIQGYCKGLVEVRDYESASDQNKIEGVKCVLFAHRTITEFLQQKAAAHLAKCLETFKPENAILQLLLAEVQDTDVAFAHPEPWGNLVVVVAQMGLTKNVEPVPFAVMSSLESAIREKVDPESMRLYAEYEISQVGQTGYSIFAEFLVPSSMEPRGSPIRQGHGVHIHGMRAEHLHLASPLHIMAYLGYGNYVKFGIQQNLSLVEDQHTRYLLLACLVASLEYSTYVAAQYEAVTDCIRSIMQHGLPFPVRHLLFELLVSYIHNCGTEDGPLRLGLRKRAIGETIAMILSASEEPSLSTWAVLYTEFTELEQEMCLRITMEGAELRNFIGIENDRTSTLRFLTSEKDSEVPLRALLDHWHFENHDEIMGILDEMEKKHRSGQSARTELEPALETVTESLLESEVDQPTSSPSKAETSAKDSSEARSIAGSRLLWFLPDIPAYVAFLFIDVVVALLISWF